MAADRIGELPGVVVSGNSVDVDVTEHWERDRVADGRMDRVLSRVADGKSVDLYTWFCLNRFLRVAGERFEEDDLQPVTRVCDLLGALDQQKHGVLKEMCLSFLEEKVVGMGRNLLIGDEIQQRERWGLLFTKGVEASSRGLATLVERGNSRQVELAARMFDANPAYVNRVVSEMEGDNVGDLQGQDVLSYLLYRRKEVGDNWPHVMSPMEKLVGVLGNVGGLFTLESGMWLRSYMDRRALSGSEWLGQEFASLILESVGVSEANSRQIMSAWMTVVDVRSMSRGEVFRLNLSSVLELEREKSGAVNILFQNYGIRHFGRYPVGVLVDQCEDFGKKDDKFVLRIMAVDDHNGAFYTKQTALGLERQTLAKLGAGMVVVEVEGQREGIRRLLRVVRERGGKENVEMVVVGAHGYTFGLGVSLGQEEIKRSVVYFWDVGSKKMRRFVDRLVKPGVKVVFDSCYAGRRVAKGVGNLGLIGVGAKSAVSSTILKFSRDSDGRLDAEVTYDYGDVPAAVHGLNKK